LRYIPSIPSFIMKGCWILSEAISIFIEMITCFLSLLLLIWLLHLMIVYIEASPKLTWGRLFNRCC
jgi:hypothetical protein